MRKLSLLALSFIGMTSMVNAQTLLDHSKIIEPKQMAFSLSFLKVSLSQME